MKTTILLASLCTAAILSLGIQGCRSRQYATIRSSPSNGTTVTIGVREKDGMRMVLVPAGEFVMGTNGERTDKKGMRWNFSNETPKHKVYLDAYWIDQTEVTVGMFRRFVEATRYETTAEREGWGMPYKKGPQDEEWPRVKGADWQHPQGPDSQAHDSHPVSQVSWEDAVAYCDWVGAELPTEAQWEKAARGTDERLFPWGNDFDGTRLNYCDSNCPVDRWKDNECDDGYAYTSPAGMYSGGASPYGTLDMAGNLWEWVADVYEADYYQRAPYKNPVGPASGDVRAMRGGSWYDVTWVWCTVRHQNPSTYRCSDVGFRCAVPANHGQ